MARRRMVRMERFSTVPLMPPSVTTSPTCMVFSSSRNRPVITSCTRRWLPKASATPNTPAPASSGAMLMPISDSTISPTKTQIATSRAERNIGSKVRSRAERAAWALAASPARWRSMARFAISHTPTASAMVRATEPSMRSSLAPSSARRNQPATGRPQASSRPSTASVTTTTRSTARRIGS